MTLPTGNNFKNRKNAAGFLVEFDSCLPAIFNRLEFIDGFSSMFCDEMQNSAAGEWISVEAPSGTVR